ncbi:hypothetical protein IU470_14815 [Nocardia abscessus]|uniref:SnoaL-like domain-containing protein n=1 Tax=Nocardia abscessus TaxID=120957 RepID=A0ABS0C993_9NOCA|nr:nuclear transport factor 2 family protein [Nocardia abscessus]MBF6226370.1 hypothetical protein [Nocardia abscessus]
MATRDEIEAFLVAYQQALSSFDAERSAALWGTPGTIVGDEFVGSLSSRADMAEGLRQSYPLYRALGLARVDHTLLGQVELTARITRLHVRWHFFDAAGALLTDSDYEYLLRRDDDDVLRVYVAVAIDEMRKLIELAAAKGIEIPGS